MPFCPTNMNSNVFFLIYTSMYLCETVMLSMNIKKDKLFQAAFDNENQKRSKFFFPAPDSINIDCISNYGPFYSVTLPIITYSNDAIYEMFRLMKISNQVCANTSSNPERIGGWFTTPKNLREGRGGLEEIIFSLFYGYFLSLEHCPKKDEEQVIKRDSKNYLSYMYKEGTLERNILYSQVLYPRIPMYVYDTYLVFQNQYKNFYEFLEFVFSKEMFQFKIDNKHQIALYTIQATDRRNLKEEFDYSILQIDTYLKISAMLHHARKKGYKMIVITIPGSDMFSEMSSKDFSKKDAEYLTSVEKGTEEAIRNYGRGFAEIVICGHRDSPKIEVN